MFSYVLTTSSRLLQTVQLSQLIHCNIFGSNVLLVQFHKFFLSEGIFILSDMTLKHNNLCLTSQRCKSPTLINLTHTELLEGNNTASGYYTINIRNVV
jgi:hypothetical protein